MRIALVTTEYVNQDEIGGGGLASYMYRTASALKQLGHEPIVFLSTRPEQKKSQQIVINDSGAKKIKGNINIDEFNKFADEYFGKARDIAIARPSLFKKIKIFGKKILFFPNFTEYFLYKFCFKNYCALRLSKQYRDLFSQYLKLSEKKNREIEMRFTEHEGQQIVEVPIFFDEIPAHWDSSFKTMRLFKKNICRILRIKVFFSFKDRDVARLSFRKYGKSCAYSFFMNKAIEKFHQQKPLDIIHYTNLSGLALFRPKTIPAVIRISGIHRLWWKVNEVRVDEDMRLQDKLEHDVLKTVEKVIVPSEIIKEEVSKIVPGLDITVIETPFVESSVSYDDEVLKKKNLENKKYILFFGQVAPLKGVVAIADMIYDLLDKHRDLHYVFVGRIYKYHGQNIDKYVMLKAKNFSDRVIFIDRVQHKFLFPLIDKAALITLPSRIDNLPNACIESMFLGKIVIGTRKASFDQLIEDGKNGFLCEIDNSKSLLNKIETALSLNDEEKHKISVNVKARIKKLDPLLVTSELVTFYKNAIDKFNNQKE